MSFPAPEPVKNTPASPRRSMTLWALSFWRPVLSVWRHAGGLGSLLRRWSTRSSSRDASGRSREPRLALGAQGEAYAERYLRRAGYRVLARGHRVRGGEIDLICIDGATVVFVEVKTWRVRGGDSASDPSEAVTLSKQRLLTRAALMYLKQQGWLEQPARFDVIAIRWPTDPSQQPQLRHYRNAFEPTGDHQFFA